MKPTRVRVDYRSMSPHFRTGTSCQTISPKSPLREMLAAHLDCGDLSPLSLAEPLFETGHIHHKLRDQELSPPTPSQ